MTHVEHKVLLLTGGNNGIGYHMVRQWLEDGGCAAVLDIVIDNLMLLGAQYPDRLLPILCDVSDGNSVNLAVQQTVATFGSIDIAVHNACICPFKDLDELALGDYRRVMEVNFLGAVTVTKAVLPFMLARKSGWIGYTSSGVGVTGFVNISSYAASKGALESFARCMRLEYRDSGVSFHILHPPLTDTKSSAPLPVPKEFMANAEQVGRGLARRLMSRKFVIAPSASTAVQIRMSYLLPLMTGGLLAMMTARAKEKLHATNAD